MRRQKRVLSSALCAAMILSCGWTPAAAVQSTPRPAPEAETPDTAPAALPTYAITPAARSDQPERQTAEQPAEGSTQAAPLPPLMGWSTWNAFREQIDEEKILSVANVMTESGLAAAGYQYLNLDDCWQSNLRDPETGSMMWDYDNFPSGPDLVNKLHEMGLKVGLYSSASKLTCEDLTASYGYETQDARAFASWGIDFLKYDYCHVEDPGQSMDLGWSDLQSAPEVDYISVQAMDAGQREDNPTHYQAEDAVLTGNARAVQDTPGGNGNICEGGRYVTGLNSAGGTITFEHVTAPSDGTYILTIGFNKSASTKGKFAQVVVNDTARYDTHIAQTSGWSATGRQQVIVNLKQGSNKIMIHNPVDSQKSDNIRRYGKMGQALKAATAAVAAETGQPERPIYYNVCEHGRSEPYTWVASIGGNSWRSSHDIMANWNSIMACYESSVTKMQYQQPGAYNDPDMMQVGNGNLSIEENRSHFTLWAMLSAPLVLGNDIRTFADAQQGSKADQILELITNEDIIALNQDLPLLQCNRVSTANNIDVLVKPLRNQQTQAPEMAVCFLNKSGTTQSTSLNLNGVEDPREEVELPRNEAYLVKDLWSGEQSMSDGVLQSGEIPAHGVKVFRIAAAEPGAVEQMPVISFEKDNLYTAGALEELQVTVTNMGSQTMDNIHVMLDGLESTETVRALNADASLRTGETMTVTFPVKIPELTAQDRDQKVDTYTVTARLTCTYAGEPGLTEASSQQIIRAAQPISGSTIALGDADWIVSTEGWGTTRRNRSIDGNTLRVAGQQYTQGIGTHADSDIQIYLDGAPYRFTATVGVDDEVGSEKGAVTFQVVADDRVVAQSAELTQGQAHDFDVELTDCKVLTLRAAAGANTDFDHADWVNPTLTRAGAVEYTVTVAQTEHGTITADPQRVAPGGSVTLTFTPEDGYIAVNPRVNGELVTLTERNTCVVSDVQRDLKVSAEFVPEGQSGQARDIQSVEQPEPITVAPNADLFELLPGQVTVYAGAYRDPVQVDVTWDTADVDLSQEGTVTVSGVFAQASLERANLTNPSNLTVSREITVEKINLARQAQASVPDGAAANGKQASWINDGIYDDQQTADGSGVFAFRKPMADLITAGTNYFELTWDQAISISEVTLSTYFGADQGPTGFEIRIPDGADWRTIGSESDIVWGTPARTRDQQTRTVSFEAVETDRLRVYITGSNETWGDSAVITEFEVYGAAAGASDEVLVNFEQPDHGNLTVTTEDGAVVGSGHSIGSGKTVTFTFTPDEGYEVTAIVINGIRFAAHKNAVTIPNLMCSIDRVEVILEGEGTTPGGDDEEQPGDEEERPGGGAYHPEAGTSAPADRYAVSKPSRVENGTLQLSDTKAQAGDTVTITVTPDAGYVLERLTVTDRDGDAITLKDKGEGVYTFKMPDSKVKIDVSFAKVPETPEAPRFLDVAQDAWYAQAVQYAAAHGLMSGMSETSFGPDATTTRAMIVTILYRLEQQPAVSGTAAFQDVAAGQYYADAVAWAAQNGIVSGMNAQTFAPNNAITREQMAAILYRYAQYKRYDVTARADLSAFADAARVGSYAVDALSWANGAGLINGISPDTLAPAGNATRAQVAAILMRFCETVAK